MNNKNQKSLSEIFKELENTRNQQIEMYKNTQKEKEENSFIFQVKQRTRSDNLKLILVVLCILFVISMFSSNYIFAKDLDTEEDKRVIGTFEENKDVTDVYEIISKNISVSYQKEIFDREENIEFETEYVENKDMPKDETIILQDGILGNQIVTYVRSFENDTIKDETAIGSVILQEPQKQIIEIGTSEILRNYNIHIGDNLFTIQDAQIKEEPDINSTNLVVVPMYYDVKSLEIIDEKWIKLDFDGIEGYITSDYLTSETLIPGITETSRRKRITDKLDFNMNLNEPSGFLESDFQRVFENNSRDTNNVFKENFAAFKSVEDKYNINGVFVAAIAIHESNYGRSTIAVEKKNLFGFGAYDSTPYQSSKTFETYAEGIDKVASWLLSNYLNESGTILKTGEEASGRYYNGATLTGVNIRYASDSGWAEKIFSSMKNIYESF